MKGKLSVPRSIALLGRLGAAIALATTFGVSAAANDPPVLSSDNLILLQAGAAGNDTWLGVPFQEGPIEGIPRVKAINTLNIDKHSSSPSPGDAIRSGDNVMIRGTGDCDCRIKVQGGAGSTVMGIPDSKNDYGVLKIHTVKLIDQAPGYQILADGTEIKLNDWIVLRDTAGAANLRLNLASAPSTMKAMATWDDATPFRIAELNARPIDVKAGGPTDWTRLGWMNGPDCSKLEWRNDGIFGTPSPTLTTAPQEWSLWAEYNAQALNAAKNDIESCLVTGVTTAGLAALISYGAGAYPTFYAAFTGCVAEKKVASNLIQDAVNLKVGSECNW